MSDEQLECALDLFRRLPPRDVEENLSNVIDRACPARRPPPAS